LRDDRHSGSPEFCAAVQQKIPEMRDRRWLI
jgi:hypothetical protein